MNVPFLLKPAGKNYLWGGDRLNTDFGKNIKLSPLAETWECSVHPDGPSTAATGRYAGTGLAQILKMHPEYLGTNCGNKGLPVLIKFIDAKQNLSVQVHPDDAYANENENGQSGKNELWYVVDAEPGACLIVGMKKDCTPDEVREAIAGGTLETLLNRIPVKKGEAYYIPAGTVHAICSGVLIAEIQQNSNLTYRLYDYNRRDAYGMPRELHVGKALDVADLRGREAKKADYTSESGDGTVCENGLFRVERRSGEISDFSAGKDSFAVILCVSGSGLLKYRGGGMPIKAGDCVFVPAKSYRMNITGDLEMLITSVI